MAVLVIAAILSALALIYFAYQTLRLVRVTEELEAENADLRARFSTLIAEMRRLREASGMAPDNSHRASDDELMPLRRGARAGSNRTRTTARAGESPDVVAVISHDPAEQKKIGEALAAKGYRVTESTLADAPQHAHALSTAALIFDLRHMGIATGTKVILDTFGNDPVAKETPVFAIVSTNVERERLIDEGEFTAVFVSPVDTALLTSSLGAALIRRRTRVQRAIAARNLSAAFSRP